MTISDIINKIYLLTNTNVNSLPPAQMLILLNNAYERVASTLLTCDKRWQWADTNNTDFDIARTDLFSGQHDYTLETTHLKILRVEVANPSGEYIKLDQYDPQDEEESIAQARTETGIPSRYDVVGTSILLDRTPNYNATNGLEVHFQRGPILFTQSDVDTGTKKPGFNSLYHELIPLWASYDYGLAYGKKNTNNIRVEIDRREDAMKKDYAGRNKTDHDIIRNKMIMHI